MQGTEDWAMRNDGRTSGARGSISDEIRKWCDDAYSGREIRTTKDLYAIADLIDSEMVELPKSADGEPIHVGDTIYDSAGNDVIVTSFSVHCEGFDIFVDGNSSHDHTPSHYTHTRPDSFERIADELEEWTAVLADCDVDAAHEFAKRIRTLAERED